MKLRSLVGLFFPRGTGLFGEEFNVIDLRNMISFKKQALTWGEL